MQRRALIITTISLGGLACAGAIAGSSALGADGAQGPPTGTLDFDFKNPSANGFGANPAHGKIGKAPKPGDIITVYGPITINGQKAGTESATLTFQGGPPTFVAVFKFNDGSQLIAQGVATGTSSATSAIVGGSGRFAGARGEITETLTNPKTQTYHESVRFIQ